MYSRSIIMAHSIQQTQTEALDCLKKDEMKSRSKERTRARQQTNKAISWTAQLYCNHNDGDLPSTEFCDDSLQLLDETTSWKDVKYYYKHLTNTIDEFKKIQKANGICISKAETALLHAKKNMDKSLRRSQRIANIIAAQQEITE